MPGPTLRCTEGDLLRIRFVNGSAHPHTVHFHGLHPSAMDGVPGAGAGIIEPGKSTVYEFDAEPFGLHLYHCHVSPLAEHIARGMYGTFIVDPKEGRPDADELVMVQNGWNTTFDAEGNQLYAVNAIPFHYVNEPIKVARDELVRIYLVNILEYDPINSFHVHGNFFNYFPTGTSLTPTEFTDTVIQGQAQRGHPRDEVPEPGPVHVPRAQDRVRRPRLDGLLRGGRMTERVPLWALAGGVIALIAVVLVTIAIVGDDTLPDRAGPPIEELAVEKHAARAEPDRADAPQHRARTRSRSPRCSSPTPTSTSTAPRSRSAGSTRRRSRSTSRGRTASPTWSRCVTSTGLVIEHEIAAAVETPETDGDLFALMALLGLYVGVIPVTLGMLLLPAMRRFRPTWIRVVMAVTVGLLAFLAVDASLEGFEIAGESGGAFGGTELVLLGAGPRLHGADRGRPLPLREARGRERRQRLPPRADDRDRDRPSQHGGGPRDRLRLRDLRAGAGRRARRRLCDPQHDRGLRDRRAAGARSGAAVASAGSPASA